MESHTAPTRNPNTTKRWELACVVIVAAAVLLPGLGNYGLVDPWETHYAEVARRMLADDDLIHTQWQNEGFRSKPVLSFWLIAASLRSLGYAASGGYSGEMVSSAGVVFAVRLPFALFGVLGIVLLWWMLRQLINRRAAWLATIVLLTTPTYFLIARQAITDMPMVGCLMGAMACFAMAMHDEGTHTTNRLLWRKISGHHIFSIVVTGFVGWQILYYAISFATDPKLGIRFPRPELVVPTIMVAGLVVLYGWTQFWRILAVSIGWVLGALCIAQYSPAGWELSSAIACVLLGPICWALIYLLWPPLEPGIWPWRKPCITPRQLYMQWFFFFIGLSVLAKGPPAVGLAMVVCLFYVAITGQWRQLETLEIPRGVWIALLIAFPWHFAMALRDGTTFVNEYFGTHIWRRAAFGVHGDRGTFDYFASQIGIGMWPWIAFLPAAFAGLLFQLRHQTNKNSVRLLIGIWAISSVALFCAVETKFHHYIFPAIPPLGIMIALWIHDLLGDRVQIRGPMIAAAIAIVLFIAWDFAAEHKQIIELFVYRYNRPWPSNAPWSIDLSNVFYAFAAVLATLLPFFLVHGMRHYALIAFAALSLSFAYWTMNGYMKHAGEHWGQRSAIVTYYKQRRIHGIDLRYYSLRQFQKEWRQISGEYPIDSFIPDSLRVGQPKTIHIEIIDFGEPLHRITLSGTVSQIDDHRFWIQLPAGEQHRIHELIALPTLPQQEQPQKAWQQVNADRLIAWQLYWRGENFWTGDEIWGQTKDTQTAFKNIDNKAFLAYLNRESAKGRKFFVITESGRVPTLRTILPTERAKHSFVRENTDSNKFTLVSFTL